MGIVDEICKEVLKRVEEDIQIIDYCIGIKYSYVEIYGKEGKALGVAYVPLEDSYSGCMASPPNIEKLSETISSLNPLDRSLSLATLNAISQYILWNSKTEVGKKGDLIELTSKYVSKKGRILVIGNMRPLINKLRSLGHEVICLERNRNFRGNCLPDVYLRRLKDWPEAVIVTGTSLLNDTVDDIIRLFPKVLKGIVGPTCALLPEVLLKYFDFVSSMRIERIEETKRIIKLGGGRWSFTPYTSQYLFTRL